MQTNPRNFARLICLLVSFVFASAVFAADVQKENNANALNLGTSWVLGAVPGTADNGLWDSHVTAANTCALGANTTWGGIKILNPGGLVTISAGNTLTLNGIGSVGIDMSAATAGLTLNAPVVLNANQTWNVNTSQTLTCTAVISGAAMLTKAGAGTLSLSALNTFSNGTTVNAGTLSLGVGGGTGAINGTLTINSGATVTSTATDSLGYTTGVCVTTVNINGGTLNDGLNGNQAFITNMNLTGGTMSSTGGGAFNFNTGFGIATLASSTTSTISAPLVIRGTSLVITTAQGTAPGGIDLSMTGVVSGGGGLVKSGPGTVSVAGLSTYTGPLTVSAGTFTTGQAFGNTTQSAVGQTNTAGISTRMITIASGATMNWTTNNVLVGGGSSAANLPTLNVSGTMASTRYNAIGNVVLSGGTLTQNATDGPGNYEGYQLLGSVTVNGTTPSFITTGANNRADHLLTGTGTVFNVADVTGDANPDLTVSSVLKNSSGDYGTGAGVLVKSGPGTMLLAAANTYTGNTTVSAGTLAIGAAGSISTSPLITVSPGAVLDGSAVTGGFSIGTTQTLLAGNTSGTATNVNGSLAINGILDVAGTGTVGTLAINGNTVFNSGSVIKFDLSNNPLSGNDQIAVTGNLTLNGTVLITPNLLNNGLTSGTYTLITYTGTLSGNASNISAALPSGTTRQSFTIDTTTTSGAILLQVTGAPATDTWVGALNGGIWDVKTTANWTNTPGDGLYYDLDNVIFDNSTVGVVTLNSAVAPTSLLFNNPTTAFFIAGSGSINGITGLTKNNVGQVTMTLTNGFIGPVAINNGTFTTPTLANGGVASPLGAGTGFSLGDAINTGTLQYTGATINTNRTVTLNAGGGQFNVNGAGVVLTQNGVISGPGAFTKLGIGALSLTAANTYQGGTTISNGLLSAVNTAALGTGTVTLNGGTLQFAGTTTGTSVGIKFSTGRSAAEVDSVTGAAGVVPISNWNNIPGLTGTNIALNDSTGAATAMQVTFSGGADNYSVYGTSQTNQDAQLLNSYLDTSAGATTNTITVANIPYATYRVYVYVASDGNVRTGSVAVGATTYYFSTDANPFPGYIQATATTLAAAANATYAFFDNVTGSTLTITQVRGNNNCGVSGVEIVSTGEVLGNNVVINANSGIDLTGTASGTLGTLAMGSQTLTVTGGSIGAGVPYSLTLGATTLSGSPTFNIINNGAGTGSVTLGALNDGGTAQVITLPGAGTLSLSATAISLVSGTQVNVQGGTLNLNAAGALGSAAQLTLASGTALNLNANQIIASLAPASSAGTIALGSHTLTIGGSGNLSSSFSGIISGSGGSLVKAGTGTLVLGAANTYSGTTTVNAGTLDVSGSVIGTPSSGAVYVGGAAASGTSTLEGSGILAGATTIDGNTNTGILAPGDNANGNFGTIGTLTTGALTLTAGAVLDFDFGTPGTGTPSSGSVSDQVAVNGNIVFPASGSVVLNLADNANAGGNGSISAGTYRLFTFTGQATNFNATTSITIGTSPLANKNYIFSALGNEIDLTITSGVQTLTWTGAADSLWNTASVDWYNLATSTSSTFGDPNLTNAIFQDAKLPAQTSNVTNNTIAIQSSGVTPISVLFVSSAVPYTFSNASSGTTGITGATGITLAGSGVVTMLSPNTYTGLTALNGGTLKIGDNSALGSTAGTIAPLSFNGGTLAFLPGATDTDISVRLMTFAAGGAAFDTNGQTVLFTNPVGNNGSGALTLSDSNATPGTLILSGANSFQGGTTITAGTLQLGNGVADGTVPGAITDNSALIYNVAVTNTNGGVISGSGTLTKNGAGILNLSGSNGYNGQTTINAGTLSAQSPGAVGTGLIDLNGGTLQLAGNGAKVGVHFSSGRVGTEIDNVTGSAGAVPMQNWNNIAGLTGSNVPLNDNTGASTAMQISFSGGATNYSVYGATQTNQDSQLLNSYLDTSAGNTTNTITVTNIPYPVYSVYVYVASDGNARSGQVTVGSTTYYYNTDASPFPGYIQTTSTNPANTPSATYAVFTNVTGGTLTITQVRGNNNNGVAGIEIVSTGLALTNNVALNANSTINVTNTANGVLGNLSMGSQMLSVTGSSIAVNTNYTLTLGTTTLSGNPTFNVSDNGSGVGTLLLGGIDDGGTARTLTLTGTGALTLTAQAVSLGLGTVVNVNGGTLNVTGAGALGSTAQVSVASGANFNLGNTTGVSSLAPSTSAGGVGLGGNILLVGSSDNLSSNFGGVISGTGSLVKAGTGTFTLSGANTTSAAMTVLSGTLAVTGSILGVPNAGTIEVGGVGVSSAPTLSGVGLISDAVMIDGPNGGDPGHLAPGVNTTGNTGGIGTLSTGTLTLNSGAVLDFDFGTPGTGLPESGGISDGVAVTGNVTFPATGSVTLNLTDNANAGGLGSLGVGTYRLLTFTGQVANFTASSITIGTTPLAGKSYNFTLVGNEIDMTISSGLSNLTWTGGADSHWNTTSLDWYNTTTAAAATYVDNGHSIVTFQDALLGGAGNVINNAIVVQAAGVSPILMTFTNTSGGVPYSFSNASGSIGISGSTGIQLTGGGTVTLLSPNTFTGLMQVNAGVLAIAGNASLGSTAAGSIAPLLINGGTLRFAPGATGTDISGRTVTVGVNGATIDTNGQSVSFANGIGNNGGGALTLNDSNASPGTLILGGANTYAGTTTITSGTLQIGNGTTDGSVPNAIVDNAALVFDVSGSTTFGNVISGTGTLAKTGVGTLALSASNSYNGATSIFAGTLSSRSSSALGTGQINLDGGTLQLSSGVAGNAIGIHFGLGRNGTEIEAVGGYAGVIPIQNWNEVVTLTGTNVALNDDSGAATNALLTFSGSPNPYSVYGTQQATPNAQLLSTYLDTSGTATTNTIVVSGIPYPNYRIYVYFGSDTNARSGTVAIGATTYAYLTDASPFPGFVLATATALANATNANYALFDNLTGSSQTITQVHGNNNSGVMAVQIVALQTSTNAVAVNTNSTIDLSGIGSGALGPLSIGSNSLSITGGTPATNANYILSLSGAALTGNPTFNIANNGTRPGTLMLGALTDGGTARTITVNAGGTTSGTLLLTNQSALVMGTIANVGGGTLRLGNSLVLGAQPLVALAAPATLDGNGQQVSGTVRGFGTLTGSLILNAGANVWPGADTNASITLTGDEVLNVSATGSVDFSAGGTLEAVITTNAGTVNKQLLSVAAGGVVILGANSILSLGYGTGSYAGGNIVGGTDVPIVSSPLGSSTLTSAFGTVNGLPSGWSIVYQFNGADLTSPPAVGNPADTVIVRTAAAGVTPATIAAFKAASDGASVLLSWDAISEFKNAGFNLYRRNANNASGAWTRVNPSMISGRITNPDLKAYRFSDWIEPGVYEYKLETVSVHGERRTHFESAGPITVDAVNAVYAVSADGFDAALTAVRSDANAVLTRELSARFAPNVDASADASAASRAAAVARNADGSLVLPATVRALTPAFQLAVAGDRNAAGGDALQPISRQVAAAAPRGLTAPNLEPGTLNLEPAVAARWFSTGVASPSYNAAKVIYGAAGVLKIPQAMMPAGFDLTHCSIQREGQALIPLAMTAGGLVVYGQGYQDDYTDKDALFVRTTNAPTAAGAQTQAQGLFASGLQVNTHSPATASVAYHDVYFDFNNYRPYNYPPWFSAQYLTGGTTQSFTFATPSASSGAATLTINIWSLTQSATVSPDHALQVLVNGQPAGQAIWSGGGKMMQLAFAVPSGALNAGNNQIDLVTPAIAGADPQVSFLHSMTMSYTQTLDGSTPATAVNSGTTTELFEVGNLPSANVWVVDARFPSRTTLVPYQTQQQADGTFTLRFNAAAGGRGQFLVVPAGQENLPISVTKRQVKPVAAGKKYWATGPSQFGSGVQPLLVQRTKEGLSSMFVDQEALFDYYNYGRYGPSGIQLAVQAGRPRYLLLVGRTTYDYLNYSGANVDPLCPTFLVSTTFWSQATSDSMFGDLGLGYPQIAVGRLPVNDTTELSGAVQHVLSYGGAPQSSVRLHAAADQNDPSVADFPAQADQIQQSNPELSWQRNYLGVTYATVPEVTAALTAAANGGADWLLYIGHGNAAHLGAANRNILGLSDIQNWTGNTVFVQSTCTANWMANDVQGYQSIAIETYMESNYTVAFMNQLLANANQSGVRWGDALMKTQQWAFAQAGGNASSYYGDLNRTEQIFGDPAMPVFSKSPAAGTINAGSTPPATGGTPSNPQAVTPGQF